MGEPLVSAFLEGLFYRLDSPELLQFAHQKGLQSKLKDWEVKLQMVAAVLGDTEEKQTTDKAVKTWLDDLLDLAYDVEDILDEFSTEALRRKSMAEHHRSNTSKVWNLIPARFTSWNPSSSVKYDVSLRFKIKSITCRLQELCNRSVQFGLQMKNLRRPSTAELRLTTTSLVNTNRVYGRDKDRKKILDMVLRDDEPSNFRVISIVGMGGLGKTTLAQLVYNDSMIQQHFDLRVWICVSDDFDVFRISKAMLQSITNSFNGHEDYNSVQIQLKEAVAGRRFLLVLDDVWSHNYSLWESLKSPFIAGAPGSRIIVTTRLVEVASIMGAIVYDLKPLSIDACWPIFMNQAFGDSDIRIDRNRELVGRKIIEKCGGLPLAVMTLGGLLRSREMDDWERILNSKIWDLPDEADILPALRLSYYHLPSYLKRCFSYCAIFPKDYEFEENELVHLWMAEGFIQQTNNYKQMKDLGGEYFQALLSRSLFQHSGGNNNSKFVMHDLINDLAQWSSKETNFRLEDGSITQRVRHASYICNFCDGKNKFKVFHEVDCLRTFLPFAVDGHMSYITSVVISDLLPKFKKLRVLSLHNYFITQLPDSIGCLKHLRYLNFSGTMIRSLPQSICSLFNLEILILRKCSRLTRLPSNMEKLINLRHLDITGVVKLGEMPAGIRELKHLHTLSNFIVSKGVGLHLIDLKNLKFLCGNLCVSNLENVIDSQSIIGGILSDKKDLNILSLEWGSNFDDSRNEVREKDILDLLQPNRKLEELTIKCYGGSRFSSWIGDPSFSNMTVLRLESCENCMFLPSLGLLDSLKDLTIKGMTRIKSVGSEFYGGDCSKAFQSLETLHFEDLQEWKHWDPIKENEYVEIFPNLRELFILDCPELSGRLPNCLPLLERLVIRECAQLVVSISSLPMLCKLVVDGCKRMVCGSKIVSKLPKSVILSNISEFENWWFQNVEVLKIISCVQLIDLWQNEISLEKTPKGQNSLSSLRELCIENCPSIIMFPDADALSTLSVLKIVNCSALRVLPEGIKHSNTNLEKLQVEGCHSLEFIVRGQLPASLKEFSVTSCRKLWCLLDDEEDNLTSSSVMHDTTNTSLLKQLCIFNCPALTCLSSRGQLPPALTHLDIRDCSELRSLSPGGHLPATLEHLEISGCSELTTVSSRGQLPNALQSLNIADCSNLVSVAQRLYDNTSLTYILIKNCKNLESMPQGLWSLRSLREIYIWDCPCLVSLPEEGFPNTNLSAFSVERCKILEALPNCLHNIRSLQRLELRQCPTIISIPVGGFPTNITSLSIADVKICWPLFEWGLHKLTTLSNLEIKGCSDVVSFPVEQMQMMLPASLKRLTIAKFSELKYLSSVGFQTLTSLEYLSINDCLNLSSFPEAGLPSSLLQLHISGCPTLEKKCKRDEGQAWLKIAHIPRVRINSRFIYDL